MNKFVYYNDTDKIVSIHPATLTHGCEVDMKGISPLEERVFIMPEDTYAWVKMWSYSTHLEILVSPRSLNNDNLVTHTPSSQEVIASMDKEFESIFGHLAKKNPHDKKEKK